MLVEVIDASGHVAGILLRSARDLFNRKLGDVEWEAICYYVSSWCGHTSRTAAHPQ